MIIQVGMLVAASLQLVSLFSCYNGELSFIMNYIIIMMQHGIGISLNGYLAKRYIYGLAKKHVLCSRKENMLLVGLQLHRVK